VRKVLGLQRHLLMHTAEAGASATQHAYMTGVETCPTPQLVRADVWDATEALRRSAWLQIFRVERTPCYQLVTLLRCRAEGCMVAAAKVPPEPYDPKALSCWAERLLRRGHAPCTMRTQRVCREGASRKTAIAVGTAAGNISDSRRDEIETTRKNDGVMYTSH
jgi:hypothetical protein